MPASATDKFKKVAPNTGWQLDASSISDASVTTFGLISATSLPTTTGVKVTVDRVDSSGNLTPSKMERINGVLSGTTISSCVRGVGGTAQAHAVGAVVEIVIDSTLWNDVMDGILAFASQAGKLILSAVDGIRYGADAGGDDTYAVTLDPVPSSYYAGMEVNFKPTTANTGACTLDVNGLGAKTIKKNVSSDLSTGDILAGQIVKVIYDGTNFQLVSTIPVVTDTTGWNPYSTVVPTRASADAPTYVLTFAGVDLTSMLSVGMRIKWTQNSTVRYAIVTAISFSTNTTLTVYGGTDYAVDDTATFAISSFFFSLMKSPLGFPLDPSKWTVKVSDTASRTGAVSANTWTNVGSINHQISIPIGVWDVEFDADVFMDRTAAGSGDSISAALSTANNTASDEELIAMANYYSSVVANSSDLQGGHVHRRKTLVLGSKTLYYLNGYMQNAGTILFNAGDAFLGATVIRAVCAYL